MQEVARLNDLGERDKAADTLDAAMKRAEAERESIYTLQLDQDRVRNDAQAAADRIIKHLRQSGLNGGLGLAVHDELIHWRTTGDRDGKPFDLQVALALAKINYDRAKGGQKGACFIRLRELP